MNLRISLPFLVCAFIALILTAPMPVPAESTLSIGYAQVDITPPLGTSMPGYFSGRQAEGLLDPLLIKSLAFTRDETTIVILAVDLIGVKKDVVEQIQQAIHNITGLTSDRLFIHATHTHTGATVSEIADTLPAQFVEAVQQALRNRKPETRAALGSAQEESVSFIRRFLMKDGTIRTNPGRGNTNVVRPIGNIDPNVNVLCFQDTKTALVSHGLHCDCVGGKQFSADYPYHLTERMKEDLGADWNVVYLNACCGNINHINVHDKNQRSSYEGSRAIGRTLGDAALRACQSAAPIEIDSIASISTVVQSPIRPVPNELYQWAKAEMEKDPEQAQKRNFNEYTPSGIIRLAETKEMSRPAEIIALRIGPVGIVGLPAECFVELSQDIKTDSLLDTTWVIGLTGGSMGYVPHPRGYQEGGYEATYSSAQLAPETPTLWCDTAIRLIREISTE
jgi:neutral ceramidase